MSFQHTVRPPFNGMFLTLLGLSTLLSLLLIDAHEFVSSNIGHVKAFLYLRIYHDYNSAFLPRSSIGMDENVIVRNVRVILVISMCAIYLILRQF